MKGKKKPSCFWRRNTFTWWREAKACKEYYKQKQTLINEKDYNEDDENLDKKMHAIITTNRTEQEIIDCFIEWNKK